MDAAMVKTMNELQNVPTRQLREAAIAWRRNEIKASAHYRASGWLRFLLPKPNLSLHDRIDDLIDEIERLRP